MDIKEIFNDIVTDVNDSNRRTKADRRERGLSLSIPVSAQGSISAAGLSLFFRSL